MTAQTAIVGVGATEQGEIPGEGPNEIAARAAVALGGLENPAVTAAAGDGVLGAWH